LRKTRAPAFAVAAILAVGLHAALLSILLLARYDEPVAQDRVLQVMLTPPLRIRHVPPPSPPPPRPDPPARPADVRERAAPPQAAAPAPRPDWRVQDTETDPADGVRKALRSGVGCSAADLLALTKAERQACQERLAKGPNDVPTYAVISPKLKKQFDGVQECPKDDVWCEYRTGKAPYPGLFAPRRKKDPSWEQ
jgi:hypothetical protein